MESVKANRLAMFCTAKRREKKQSQNQQKRTLIFMRNRGLDEDNNIAGIIDLIFYKLKLNLECLITNLRAPYFSTEHLGNSLFESNGLCQKIHIDETHALIKLLNEMHEIIFSSECYFKLKQEVLVQLQERGVNSVNISKTIECEIYDYFFNHVLDTDVIGDKVEVLKNLKGAMHQAEEPVSDIILRFIGEIRCITRCMNEDFKSLQFVPFAQS